MMHLLLLMRLTLFIKIDKDSFLKEECEIQARRSVSERFNVKRVAESVSAIYLEIKKNVG